MVALFVVLTIITFLTVDWFVQRAELRKGEALAKVAPEPGAVFARLEAVRAPASLDRVPLGLFFDRGHTWAALEAGGALKVGTGALPVAVLGEPESAEWIPPGTEVRKGDPIVRFARRGRELTLRAPADGVIERVNHEAFDDPARIHQDPLGEGWLYVLSPKRVGPALRGMLVGEEALQWMREELARLRASIAGFAMPGAAVGATLPDGGVPIDGLAGRLDGPRWDEVSDAFFGSRGTEGPGAAERFVDPFSM